MVTRRLALCPRGMALPGRYHATHTKCAESVHLGKSGENDLDVMKQARATYRDENKGTLFVQEDAWEVLKSHAKWDAPSPVEPVDLTWANKSRGQATRSYSVKMKDHVPRAPAKPPILPKEANPRPRRAPREVTRQTHSGAYVNRISS
ncbi:hypothetical protein Tco_1112376 [Tanacetum coccineum]|uniref:Uncharacterized protein n=1 Tax=Tanacetum coccineum TaxID=301880 RepID=A0ABQ5IRY1_9ASTR